MKCFALITMAALCHGPACRAGEEVIKDEQDMDCHVYTPDPVDPGKTYQLVVGVHGAGGNGNGAAGMKGWAQRGDVIVIGPSFQIRGESTYQSGDGVHADKLLALFKLLGKRYRLNDRMFLHGFSGGSQFVHRFVMLHPDAVCGASAHSGGSWATDGYGTISTKARKVPFAISCGEKDTGKAWGDAPYNRLEWFGRFRDEIDKKGFCHAASSWPDVGHQISPGAWDLARECFQLATGLPGKSATERVEISGLWKNLDRIGVPEAVAKSGSGEPKTPYVDPAELAKMTEAAFRKADESEIPDDKLVSFMTRYPPILWKDQPGAGKLLEQCTRAALAWRLKAVDANAFKGENLNRFEAFSRGLAIPAPAR